MLCYNQVMLLPQPKNENVGKPTQLLESLDGETVEKAPHKATVFGDEIPYGYTLKTQT